MCKAGDPLSTYLFMLAMGALSWILSRAREGGFISSFKVGGRRREGMEVFHILFVNDTVILCDVNQEHLEHLS